MPSLQAQDDTNKSAKDKKSASSKKSADKSDRKYMVGSRGGCYYLNEGGQKKYVDKKYCESVTVPASDSKTPDAAPAPATTAAPEADSKTNTPATNTEKTEKKPNDAPTADAPENNDQNSSDTTSSPKKPAPAAETTGGKKNEKDGKTYILGPKGGCYYLTESGKKVYVKDKSLCGN